MALPILIASLSQHDQSYAQLPAEGVIFDDFTYTSVEWCSEVNTTGQEHSCQDMYPANPVPPSGSVFGPGLWHTNVGGSTTSSRAWYRYLWQEQYDEDEGTSFVIASGTDGNSHLVIRADAGTYSGHEAEGTSPRQIISGFTARRGTWAARVNFGNLEPANAADLVQAFWTLSLAFGQGNDGSVRWNEFDFEWNSRFNGKDTQTHPYLRTGHTIGDISSANATTSHVPLYSPAWPDDDVGSPTNFAWSCKFIWGDNDDVMRLCGSDCSAIVLRKPVLGNTPVHDPSMVLFLQITDESVYYEIASSGWGGVLVARSDESNRVPSLPMATVFSQHIQNESTLSAAEDFSIDWFYYSPATTIDVNDVQQQVDYLRNTAGIPRLNSTGMGLERPYAHLSGYYSPSNRRPNRTTSLSLDLSHNPASMERGSTATLLALPPLRHGFYQYSWRYRKVTEERTAPEWIPMTQLHGGWEASFTFPTDATAIEVEVALKELESPGNPVVIDNSTVFPITQTFTIDAKTGKNEQNQPNGGAPLTATSLMQNYPNPFNPSTEIGFRIAEPGHVSLTVYDMLGREISRLVDGYLNPGSHSAKWDAQDLPSGQYFYVLATQSVSQHRRMILVK